MAWVTEGEPTRRTSIRGRIVEPENSGHHRSGAVARRASLRTGCVVAVQAAVLRMVLRQATHGSPYYFSSKLAILPRLYGRALELQRDPAGGELHASSSDRAQPNTQ